MSQPLQSPRSASPLTARLYDLEYPRSLGVYSTYQEVQSVVDTLADKQFPVQSTLIVGTDLKLMERVTGRRTWPKVISQGALSGLWMGLFLGLLLFLLSPGSITILLTSVVLGIVFFTVSSVIGYAMSGGRRDFTSMTATIPMQYELLVEHKHAAEAQRILAESGAAPAPVRALHGDAGQAPQFPSPGGAAPHQGGQQYGGQQGGQQYGAPAPGAPQYGASTPSAASAARPSYGRPALGEAPQGPGGARSGRPSFGAPSGVPLRDDAPTGRPSGSSNSTEAGGPSYGASAPEAPSEAPSTAPSGERGSAAPRPPHDGHRGEDTEQR